MTWRLILYMSTCSSRSVCVCVCVCITHRMQNSERTPGLILSSLKQFPLKHCFSIVGRKDATFRDDCVALIERVCQSEVEPGDVKEVERLGGKYVSLQVGFQRHATQAHTHTHTHTYTHTHMPHTVAHMQASTSIQGSNTQPSLRQWQPGWQPGDRLAV